MLNLIKCGSTVEIINSKYSGHITGISIRDDRISYGISFFENGVHVEKWFQEYEFRLCDINEARINIGFIN